MCIRDSHNGTPTAYLKYFSENENLEYTFTGYTTTEIIFAILELTIFSGKDVYKRQFHTSFKLNPETANWVGLFDSGKKLLDQIVVPAGALGPNQSYARVSDGAAEWEVKSGSGDKYVTPSTNNQTLDSNSKMEKFEEHDALSLIHI